MKHPSSFLKYLLPRSYIIFTSLRAHGQKPLVSKLPSPSLSSPLHKEVTSSKRQNNIPFSSSFPNLNVFRFPLPWPAFPNTVMTNDNKNDEVKTALSNISPGPRLLQPRIVKFVLSILFRPPRFCGKAAERMGFPRERGLSNAMNPRDLQTTSSKLIPVGTGQAPDPSRSSTAGMGGEQWGCPSLGSRKGPGNHHPATLPPPAPTTGSQRLASPLRARLAPAGSERPPLSSPKARPPSTFPSSRHTFSSWGYLNRHPGQLP